MRQENVGGGRPRQRLVKLTEEEDQVLNAAALRERMTVPAYLVQSGLNAAGMPSERQRSAAAQDLMGLEYQLARIGNNLNQMARQMNTDGSVHADLTNTLVQVRDALRRIEPTSARFIEQVGR
ncbi:plasmid mobilization relaxosome protein MobC [Brevibacterium sp. 5221]|uniref:Plasmid mobilization relaxosome protein MobC n=1 Tax=Brevibacterium rongguiense TaxID=2695267 RepID=A0A6N9H8X5_9MICO|nr:MobC family plasmid mobilization relaxosome protein [Brevibacterium rongguiense]MYM20473.1 plasmid mobilization relaxosome protein MobC [Brevibacterium rongguiense]